MPDPLIKSTLSHFNPALVTRAIKTVDPITLGIFVYNYLVQERDIYFQNKHGQISPTSMHIELTTYCPRRCIDCYIPLSYREDKTVIDSEIALKAVQKGKSIGMRTINLIGGETLSEDTLPVIELLLRENPWLSFYCCTNGQLISSLNSGLDNIVKRHNFSPGLSIDGFKEMNDAIRGNGAYHFAITAAEYLLSRKSFFGALATIRPSNEEEVLSNDFVNFIINQGFSFMLYSFSGALSEESLSEAANSLRTLRGLPIFIYINSLGHIDDPDPLKRTRIVYVDKKGNVLNDRREREHITTIGGLEAVASSKGWLKRFDGIYAPKNSGV